MKREMNLIIYLFSLLKEALTLLVVIHVILSYVLDYYHPVRRWVDSVIEPMLMPIRRVVPLVGMLDFSPIILIVLIRIVFNLIMNILS
jgi:YggT family protein